MLRGQSAALDWHEEEVPGPDVESRETLQVLAKMTNNAYYDGPQEKGWYDLGGNWTQVSSSLGLLARCMSESSLYPSRMLPLAGNLTKMAFVVTYS